MFKKSAQNGLSTKSFNWELIVLLWLVFFFNQADRQVFNVILPQIKTDLKLTDAELGMIASVFIWAIGLCVPLSGYVGDVFSKKKVIIFSLLLWSTATFFTGLSAGLFHLVILRGIVGSSESFYAPAANALIGEKYKDKTGLAMAIHQTALYAGIIMSGLIGALIAERFGWSTAFYFFGGIGILLSGVLMLRFKKIILPEVSEAIHKITLFDGLKGLFERKTAILLTLAFACMVFVNVGYLTWAPTFLHEKFKLSLANAGFSSMFYHHVFAFLGVLLGGRFSDRFAKINVGARLKIQAFGLLLGCPFIYLLGSANDLFWVYAGMGLFGFFRGIYDSNIYASLFLVTPTRIRASVSGAMIMFAFLIGAFAPWILGYLKPTLGLSNGLSSLSFAYLLGSIFIFIALKFTLFKEVHKASPDQNFN
ncbi:putative glucarate transporter [compost metagenome]|uniref:MFS transporter n=1 Tax=Pedobacter sp. ok626 TaxID=1761882 RepID=UPI00088AD378|nr:MFS transporter [Pedobacter sp. ok626]SDL86710.1 Sugar phosphate permease [Pedobacter sp. ok626]